MVPPILNEQGNQNTEQKDADRMTDGVDKERIAIRKNEHSAVGVFPRFSSNNAAKGTTRTDKIIYHKTTLSRKSALVNRACRPGRFSPARQVCSERFSFSISVAYFEAGESSIR